MAMELHGERVVLRPTRPDDIEPFTAMLREPDVAQWWPGYDNERVRLEYFDEPDGEATVCAIEYEGRVVGLIQSYEESDPDYRHAGIDISLTSAVHGQGLGTDAVRALARHLFEVDDHHRLVIDPAASNARAIACYAKVGFRPVGVMRQYERVAEGVHRDGLLMDLLRHELR